MLGLICNDKVEQVGHLLFNNFRLALYNYFGIDNFKDVNSVNDIKDVTHLFIVDEHFVPNVNIWKNDEFINTANNTNIIVIVFNFEKVYNSHFPWNVEHQDKLEQFINLYQIVSDTNDATMLNKPYVNRQRLSKSTKLSIPIINWNDKYDKVLFIGQLGGAPYTNRENIIKAVINKNTNFEFEIVKSNRQYSYSDFLIKLNEYKYILNPLGTGSFINLRFYEAAYFNCKIIQQLTPDIIKWCPEIYNRCIPITNDDLQIDTSHSIIADNIYLEDWFTEIELKNII